MIKSGRVVFFAAALALAAALVATGDAAAMPTTVTGTIQVVGTVTVDSSIPANATISARAGASMGDVNGSHDISGSITQVTRSGATATVTFTMPYVLTNPNLSGFVLVFFAVSASSPGSTAFPTASESKQIPLPANGSTTVVKLPAAI